jgi:putative ABC transport system permease protein
VSHQMMFWRMLFAAMIRRRSRAVMAVVSSAVGAATMFCLMAVCLAVPAQMSAEIRQFGANLVVIPVAAGDAHAEITSPQGDAIVGVVTRDVPARSAGYRYENVRINRTPYLLAGIEVSQAESLNRHWDVDGRWPQAGEALVGVDVAQATGLQVGSVVTIEQVASDSLTGTSTSSANARQVQLRVAGIVQTGAEEDAIVYTTVADVAALTQQERGWDVVEFSVDTSAVSMDQVIAEVLASDATVSARPVSKITTADTRIISMLTTLFWVVSIVVLTLTLVGVSTTMTVIVSERRQEIGLRKALGASNRDIAREFRTEAIAYGLVGGIVGTAIGYGLAQIVSLGVFNRAVGFEPLMALGSVLVAALVAALAAFSPVRRASRFEPAVVLRED